MRASVVSYIIGVLAATSVLNTNALSEGFVEGQVGGVHYNIPEVYRASASRGSLYVEAALPNWGPLINDKPGWNDHLQILVVENQGESMGYMWDRLYDGSPRVPGKPYNIVSTRRIEPDFTVYTMESGEDVFVPDQNRSDFPDGFIVCGSPKPPTFPYASCSYYFNKGAQRWQITFGRQFVDDFKKLRAKATEFIRQFEGAT